MAKGKRCYSVNGFTIPCNRYIGAEERGKLEELLAYGSRAHSPTNAYRSLRQDSGASIGTEISNLFDARLADAKELSALSCVTVFTVNADGVSGSQVAPQ